MVYISRFIFSLVFLPICVDCQNIQFEKLTEDFVSINKKIKELKNEDFSFLDNELKNINVFVIGETNHQSGLSYDLECKLVNYLHKKHGFNLVLMEDIDMYLATKFTEEYLGYSKFQVDTSTLLNSTLSLFHFNQFPLLKYIINSKWTDNPIKLGGLALYEYGLRDAKADSLTHKLDIYLKKYVKNSLEVEYWNTLNLSKFKIKNVDTVAYKEMIFYLNKSIPVFDLNGMYHLQILKNLLANYRTYNKTLLDKKNNNYTLIELYKARDAQMADNVLFYINKYFPNKKTIVITTLYHSLKNVDNYREKTREWKSALPMGTVLTRTGFKFYNLGIFCNIGYYGKYSLNSYRSKDADLNTEYESINDTIGKITFKTSQNDINRLIYDTIRVPKRDLNSLESYLGTKAKKMGFLSFKNYRSKYPNDKINFIMHPLDDSLIISRDWTKSFDGVYFINEMKPVRYEDFLEFPIPKKYEYNEDDFPFKNRNPTKAKDLVFDRFSH